jgi:hypothetical protein
MPDEKDVHVKRHKRETRAERKAYKSLEELEEFMRTQTGHRPPRNYENMEEINRRLQVISPSETMKRILEYEELQLLYTDEPVNTRRLLSHIQAIALAIASGEDLRPFIDNATSDLDRTDMHYLSDAVAEMQRNLREYERQAAPRVRVLSEGAAPAYRQGL